MFDPNTGVRHSYAMDALQLLPDSCPDPQTKTLREASPEAIAWAAISGLRIVDEPTGAIHILPPPPDEIAAAADLIGAWCRRCELANWLAGEEKYSWFHVEQARPRGRVLH